MLTVLLAAAVATLPVTAMPLLPPAPLSARVLDAKVIRTAVSAALVQEAQSTAALASERATGDTILRGAAYENFGRTFADARVPDCLHADALKNQFTPIGGIYAAPFVLLAKLRGKCN